jgi:tetratricopeptide (TPR) repeat protein
MSARCRSARSARSQEAALWLLVWLLPPTAAYAQERAPAAPVVIKEVPAADGDVERARAHFKRGVDHYRDGDAYAALTEFKRAYVTAPNYRLLFNLGQVSQELRDYPAARDYYARYLQEAGEAIEPARRSEVEAALVKIKNRIGALELTSSLTGTEFFVDDVSVGSAPLATAVEVSAGQRRISAKAAGREPIQRLVDVVGEETERVHFDFPPPSAPQAVAHAKPSAEPASGFPPAFWLGIGTGALAVGTGVMAILTAQDNAAYQDALERPTSEEELEEISDRTKTKALITDILLGATVAAAATTVVFVVIDANDRERAEPGDLSLRIAPGGLSLQGRFQ